MKTIKQLEAEIGKVRINIENCCAAENSHDGWDDALEKLVIEYTALKDVLGLIDEIKIRRPKGIELAYIDWFKEELKSRINRI